MELLQKFWLFGTPRVDKKYCPVSFLIWIRGTNIYKYVNGFPGVVEYSSKGLPYYCNVAMVDLTHAHVLTAYPSY